MRIVDIFDIVNHSLLAVKFEGEKHNEFRKAFENWTDIEFLHQYFNKHYELLSKGYYKQDNVETAVFKTVEEAELFREKILNTAETGTFENTDSLQDIVFKPLSDNTAFEQLEQSKSYGTNKQSWLRIYAIRIDAHCYVVSGSGIKLTQTMQEDSLLKIELQKLKITQKYLQEFDIESPSDLGYIDIQVI